MGSTMHVLDKWTLKKLCLSQSLHSIPLPPLFVQIYKLSVCIAQRSVRTQEERNFVANLRLLRCGVGLEMALCRIIVDCVAC